MYKTIRNKVSEAFFGKPLATAALSHEKLTVMQGLAIFASDALSSTAYATEEMLVALSAVGLSSANLAASIPIAVVIVAVIAIVTISYRQVINAYPHGGGVYNVAKANLNEWFALVGAASLLIDYILTPAVSIAAGVAAIISAYVWLAPYRVALCISLLLFLAWMNLRGVRESGRLFSIPTYAFIVTSLSMIIYGFVKYLTGGLVVPHVIDSAVTTGSLGLLSVAMIIKTFSSGCTAMTGIEAVSNGVQAFKAPESANASKAMTLMAILLSVMFLGITILAYLTHAVPMADQTVIAQIARTLFGTNWIFYLVSFVTLLILILAANTPYAGFPRVLSVLAKDGYFPNQFMNLGSRLVFQNGIITLAITSSVLLYLFHGDVHALIPLYAIGVFLGFSISQLGMVIYWLRQDELHLKNLLVNAIGCVVTVIVFLSELYSKFREGAWTLIPTVLLMVTFMKMISNYYRRVSEKLAINGNNGMAQPKKTIVVLVSKMSRAALHAVNVAKTFQPEHLLAVHVAIDPSEADDLKIAWNKYVPDVSIDILISEYRDLINPVLDYLKNLDAKYLDDEITVVIPEIVPEFWWGYWLHNQTASLIRRVIIDDPQINAQVLEVPTKIGSKL